MSIVIETLLYAAVALALASTWLMLRMRDEYQMLHFMSPPASVSAILIAAAIFLQQRLKPESFKAAFIVVVLMVMNMVLTHATARAFRIRESRDDWQPRAGQEVPVLPSDERLSSSGEK